MLRATVAVALLGAVAYQFARSYGKLREHPPSFTPSWAIFSLAALGIFMFVASEAWRKWMAGLGSALGRGQAFRILYLSNLAKYLPGGIWNFIGRVGLAQREGVSAASVSISILLELACQLGGATLVALPTLLFFPAGRTIIAPSLLVLAAALLVAALHPRVMNFALALGERIARRPTPRIAVPYTFILRMLALYAANWLLLGLAFAALAQALVPDSLGFARTMVVVGAFVLSYNAGVFAFFLPAGLGVREVALVFLLGQTLASPWPATLALVARFWVLVGEVGCFLVALAISRKRPVQEPPRGPCST
jgi:Lysylphosphatidylglycerol synthase TM region